MKTTQIFRTIGLLLILATGTISYAQEVHPFPMEERSLLWQVEGPNVKNKCYLFGTMHIIPTESFFFPKKLEKIISKSEQLTMELAGIPNNEEVMELLKLKEGSLVDFFDSLQLDSLHLWANEKMGLAKDMFNTFLSKMKPVAIIQMATQLKFGANLSSYELTFQEIAEDNNQVISGLETIEFQLSLFDNLSENDQAELVMESIRDDKKAQESNEELLKLYSNQDIDALYAMLTDEDDVISTQQKSFLDDRNADWIPKIKAMITEMKTVIAVGAGHLGGPNGVIRLLEQEGYTLTPIKL